MYDQAMRSQLDVNQQLLQQLATPSARVDKTKASGFSTPQIAEPPAPEDDSVSCIPPPRPGSLCRRCATSGACDFVTEAAPLDDGQCPDLARALSRTNEVLDALQREVSDLRTEVRAAPKVALARGSVPLGVRDRRRCRALVGPAPPKSCPSADMVAGSIKAGLESESDSDEKEPKPAPGTTTPYSAGKMDDDARQFRTELDPVFGQPIRLGPKMAGLTPLRISFSRFTYVVHYAVYRLRRTEPVSDKSYEDNYERKRRIASVMKHHCFDGVNPVSVLGFLRRLKVQSDLNNLTEGTAFLFLPDFLEEPARSEFLAYNDVGAGTGVMYAYTQAIQWLLNRYSKDRYLEPAIDQFERARQRDHEEENDFGLLLFKMAATFGGAYREHDLISRFIRGLSSTLRPLLTAERAQADFSDCKSYSQVVERACTIGESHRALADTIYQRSRRALRPPASPQRTVHRRDPVRAEQVGYVGSVSPQSSKGNRASRSGSSRDGILALEPDQTIDASAGTSASVYETPEHSARGVETLRVSNTPDTAQYGTALDEVLSEEDLDADVAVNTVDRAQSRARFSSQGKPPARPARPPNDIDICYQCFRLGNGVQRRSPRRPAFQCPMQGAL